MKRAYSNESWNKFKQLIGKLVGTVAGFSKRIEDCEKKIDSARHIQTGFFNNTNIEANSYTDVTITLNGFTETPAIAACPVGTPGDGSDLHIWISALSSTSATFRLYNTRSTSVSIYRCLWIAVGK